MAAICNLKKVVFQATIFPKENVKHKKVYIGISSVRWKLVYNNYIHSFSREHLKHQTALSKHFWKLKNRGLTLKIQWKKLKDIQLLAALMKDVIYAWRKRYKLLYIDPVDLLNQRCDFIARYRHRNKFKLF